MPEVQILRLKKEKQLSKQDEDYKLIKKCYESIVRIENEEVIGINFLGDKGLDELFSIFTDIKIKKIEESKKHKEKIFTIDNDEDLKLLCECYRTANYESVLFFKKLVKLKFGL